MLQRVFDRIERRLLLWQINKIADDIHHEILKHREHDTRMDLWFGEIARLKACVAELERAPLRLNSWLSMSRGTGRRETPANKRFVYERLQAGPEAEAKPAVRLSIEKRVAS